LFCSETSDAGSDVEGRIFALQEELKRRHREVERLKREAKRRYREQLKVKEQALKKQIEVCLFSSIFCTECEKIMNRDQDFKR
jgi:hypothetical protein